jgi:anti-sigma factor RsiW
MDMYDDRTIWRHLDGELPDAEARSLEDALARDPALGRRVEELREVSRAARGGVPKPPPDFAARVVARAMAGPVAPVLPLDDARRFLRRVVIAASIFAAIGLVYLAWDVLPKLLEAPLWADNPLLGK